MAKNIIIVDDELHIAKAIKLVLSGQGYNLKIALNANEAWGMINEETDLVLLDILMPGMRAIDLIKTIRDHRFGAKCMYISAVPFTEEQRKEMIKEEVVVDFIQKPFENVDLLRRVKKALGEE